MKSRALQAAAIALLACTCLQCEKGEDASTLAPEASSPATPGGENTKLSDEAIDQSDIAVPEDFEDEAFSTIDEDNLEEQLDALEREISGDVD